MQISSGRKFSQTESQLVGMFELESIVQCFPQSEINQCRDLVAFTCTCSQFWHGEKKNAVHSNKKKQQKIVEGMTKVKMEVNRNFTRIRFTATLANIAIWLKGEIVYSEWIRNKFKSITHDSELSIEWRKSSIPRVLSLDLKLNFCWSGCWSEILHFSLHTIARRFRC